MRGGQIRLLKIRKEKNGYLGMGDDNSLYWLDRDELSFESLEAEIIDYEKLSYNFDRFYSFPVEVKWDITYKCNLKCLHCYSSSGEHGEYGLSLERCKKIIDILAKYGVFRIQILGGEPFCRKDIFEIIKYVKDHGLGVIINTNGTLIDEDVAQKIKQLKVNYVQVGLDGIGKVHDEFRGKKGCYKMAVKGITALVQNQIPTGVVSVVTKTNTNDLNALVYLCADMGVDSIQFLSLMCSGRGTNLHDRMLEYDDYIACSKSLMTLKRSFPDLLIDAPGLGMDAADEIFLNKHKSTGDFFVRHGCKAGVYSVQLDPQGNIGICLQSDKKFGNLLEDDINDILERVFAYKKESTPLQCKNCKNFLKNCWGRCIINGISEKNKKCFPT